MTESFFFFFFFQLLCIADLLDRVLVLASPLVSLANPLSPSTEVTPIFQEHFLESVTAFKKL